MIELITNPLCSPKKEKKIRQRRSPGERRLRFASEAGRAQWGGISPTTYRMGPSKIAKLVYASSILHGYFNPLVFWYQWDYLLTSKEFIFLQGIQDWPCISGLTMVYGRYNYDITIVFMGYNGVQTNL